MTTPFHIENLGRRYIQWNAAVVTLCEYVDEGEEVYAPFGDNLATKVTVKCAAGMHARVEGKKVSGWFHVNDLSRLRKRKKDKQSA